MNKKKINIIVLGFFIFTTVVLFNLTKGKVEASTKQFSEIQNTNSLCQPKEEIIWSCSTTKNKIASVCASNNLSSEQGYLQYRFGKIGAIELELPQNKEGSQSYFKYSRYTRPLVTMLQLTFENGEFQYQIHDDDNSEEKPPIRSASIDISKIGDEKTTSIVCKKPISGSLMNLEDIVTKDEN